MNENEVLHDIPGCEGRYMINANGKVFSIRSNMFLKTCLKNGYHVVKISNNGRGKRMFVHRLLAFTFIPNPESKPFINHKNGIKSDNRLKNLEWCTSSENVKHAYAIGLNVGRTREMLSPEALYRMKMAKLGKPSKLIGSKQTEQHKQNVKRAILEKCGGSSRYSTILNLNTGIYYRSLREACGSYHKKMSLQALYSKLNGKIKNDTPFISA